MQFTMTRFASYKSSNRSDILLFQALTEDWLVKCVASWNNVWINSFTNIKRNGTCLSWAFCSHVAFNLNGLKKNSIYVHVLINEIHACVSLIVLNTCTSLCITDNTFSLYRSVWCLNSFLYISYWIPSFFVMHWHMLLVYHLIGIVFFCVIYWQYFRFNHVFTYTRCIYFIDIILIYIDFVSLYVLTFVSCVFIYRRRFLL